MCIKIVRPFPDGKERNSSHQINLSILFYLAIYNDRSQALVKNVLLITKNAKINGSTTTTYMVNPVTGRGVINGKAGKHLPYPNFETIVIL